MIIMLEGVDGSGKSTLAKHIANRLIEVKKLKGIEVYPHGELTIPTHPKDAGRLDQNMLLRRLDDMINDKKVVYIVDRGPISDIIYRTFDEHQPVINLDTFMTRYIGWMYNIVFVHCRSSKSEELMLKRGDDNPVAINHHKQLQYLFDQIMALFVDVTYDVAEQGANMLPVVNMIIAKLLVRSERQDTLAKLAKEVQNNEHN